MYDGYSAQNQSNVVLTRGSPWSGVLILGNVKGKVSSGGLTTAVVSHQSGLSSGGPLHCITVNTCLHFFLPMHLQNGGGD